MRAWSGVRLRQRDVRPILRPGRCLGARIGPVSWVANVMISASIGEDPKNLADFSEWLRVERRGGRRRSHQASLESAFCGQSLTVVGLGRVEVSRGPHLGSTTNRADIGAIVEHFESTPWREPWTVQLFVQDQEQDYFRVWMLRDGVAQQVVPDPHPALTAERTIIGMVAPRYRRQSRML
jgi:hypothetical protein